MSYVRRDMGDGPKIRAAVSVEGEGGALIYISGQVARDAGIVLHPDDMGRQSKEVFRRISQILDEAGTGLHSIIKLTAYLTDMERYDEYDRARHAAFEGKVPASTTVGATALVSPEMLVEVEAVAFKAKDDY